MIGIKELLSDITVVPLKGAITKQEVKGWYILYMTNMYYPLFFMTFYNLGLDNIKKFNCFEKRLTVYKKDAPFYPFGFTYLWGYFY